MGRASHFKTIAYTDASPVFSRFLRRRDAWTNGDMHAIRRLPHQLFEGVSAGTFLHSNRLSSCCRRGKYPHSTEPVPDRVRGTLPWYRTCFSTSWCCWDSCGSASCCMMPGPTSVPEGIRSHPSLCRRRASVPAPRSRFLASPVSPPVPPVSRPTRTHPNRPVARHPARSPRVAARARWTPRRTSAPSRPVPIGAGSGSAISVPMDFLPFVNPHLSIFLPHLHDWLTTNPGRIIAGTFTQHGHQDTQQ